MAVTHIQEEKGMVENPTLLLIDSTTLVVVSISPCCMECIALTISLDYHMVCWQIVICVLQLYVLEQSQT